MTWSVSLASDRGIHVSTRNYYVIIIVIVNPPASERPLKMSELLNTVDARATDKWKRIGLQLDIAKHRLASISEQTQDHIDCYSKVLSLWQKSGNPPFTWATIIDALKVPIVGEDELANELEEWLKQEKRKKLEICSLGCVFIKYDTQQE